MSKTSNKKDRLNIRIDPELHQWAKKFAKQHNITVTDVIMRGLLMLKQQESGGGTVEVPQF